jgi:hypothetical protein
MENYQDNGGGFKERLETLESLIFPGYLQL